MPVSQRKPEVAFPKAVLPLEAPIRSRIRAKTQIFRKSINCSSHKTQATFDGGRDSRQLKRFEASTFRDATTKVSMKLSRIEAQTQILCALFAFFALVFWVCVESRLAVRGSKLAARNSQIAANKARAEGKTCCALLSAFFSRRLRLLFAQLAAKLVLNLKRNATRLLLSAFVEFVFAKVFYFPTNRTKVASLRAPNSLRNCELEFAARKRQQFAKCCASSRRRRRRSKSELFLFRCELRIRV